ncbi:MAG TPA: hypothetical protein VKZ49_07380, partial [Polyangiaceae bacterium]|nr:hypothetical protein [Polyangiaceae bacterium]
MMTGAERVLWLDPLESVVPAFWLALRAAFWTRLRGAFWLGNLKGAKMMPWAGECFGWTRWRASCRRLEGRLRARGVWSGRRCRDAGGVWSGRRCRDAGGVWSGRRCRDA